jgi:lysophospholipase L1-like esterase
MPDQAKVAAAPANRLRELFAGLAVLLITVLVFCAVAEIGLRIAYRRSLDFSMEMWKYAVQLKRPVSNPLLSFAHAPGRSAFLMGVPVSINSYGLRDREYSIEKPADVYRIVMLGDSTTFGWGAPAEQTVAKILERDLNAAVRPGQRHFEVLNAGVGNYGTVQEYNHYLTYDRALHPDLVILEYFINDPEPVPSEHASGLLGTSYLVAFAAARGDLLLRSLGKRPNWKEYYAGLYRDDAPGFIAAKRALGDLAAAVSHDGAKLLVTILPELHEINSSYPFTKEQQKIKDVAAANHLPVIDLIDGLRNHGPESTLWVTPADDHPNGKANSLIADQILPFVLQTASAPLK